MDKRKILFVAYLYPPAGGKGLPGVQRSVKFVRYLSGLEKYVLTLQEDLYPEFFSTDNRVPLPIKDEKIIRIGTVDLFKVFLGGRQFLRSLLRKSGDSPPAPVSPPQIVSPVPANKNTFGKLKDFVSDVLTFPDYAYAWMVPAIRKGRKLVGPNDVIFATGMPWTCLAVGWILKRLTGAKLIADFRDPWVNNPFATDKSLLKKTLERYTERKIVTAADIVSLNTQELRDDFVRRYPSLPAQKFVAMVNGYDAYDFRGILQEDAGEKSDALWLTHGGLLYGLRDPKPILEAIAKLRKTNPELARKIRFRQMGDTRLNYDLKAFVAENSLEENYEDMGQVPFSEALRRMSLSDILVIIQQDTKTQIPSKIYEYIYLNKPILTIAQKDGALGNLIKTYEFGDIFEADDTDGLANYLMQKVQDKENGRAGAVYVHREKFDVRTITNRLETMINQIIN
jgi:hypothetical protein